jgi:hypothetical protein
MLSPNDFAVWVLDALGEIAGDAPPQQLAELAAERAEQGGLLLLIDDASSMPPATRDALDHWYGESNGALRSVQAGTGIPSASATGGSSDDARLTLEKPLSFEESRALLAAAMDRSQLGAEARALFDFEKLKELHESTRGVPTRLLVEASRALFARREGLDPAPSGPLFEWDASADASPHPAREPLAQPAPEAAQEPLAPPPSPARAILESSPVHEDIGDQDLLPSVRSTRRRILTAASYAGAFGAGVLATLVAIPFLGGDSEPAENSVVDIASSIEIGGMPAALVAASDPVPESVALPALPPVSAARPAATAPSPLTVAAIAPVAAPVRAAVDDGPSVTGGVIGKGEWLAASFRNHGIPMPILSLIDREVGDRFDFTRSLPGQRYTVTRDSGGELVEFRYAIGRGDELRVHRTAEGYTVTLGVPVGSQYRSTRNH